MIETLGNTKATSSAESKPDQRAKEQIKASTAETTSAAAGTANGKAPKAVTAQAARRSSPENTGMKRRRTSKVVTKTNGVRKRGPKPYPIVTFAEILPLAEGIFKESPSQPVKRATVLRLLGKDPNSEAARLLVINSGKYGLTEGGVKAEHLSLTPRGKTAVNAKASRADHLKARFDLAIGDIPAFKALYDKRQGNNMPAPAILYDDLQDIDDGDRKACADVFTDNVKYLGLLVPRDGAEFLMTVDEWIGQKAIAPAANGGMPASPNSDGTPAPSESPAIDYDTECFVVSVIKDPNTPQRTHADAMLHQYVEKSLEGTGLRAVRADKIGDPGMISRQIVEHVTKAKLVVVDLSFGDPNVFYELALRHVTGKPTVHLTRVEDKLPFDVGNFRAISIDTSNGYTMVREIDTIRSQIAAAIRSALANGENRDNPILTYCPTAKFVLNGS